MKLIVDIPDEMYDWFENGFPDEYDYVKLWEKIKQGTPLEEELEKILSCTNSMAKNIIEQGPPNFNGFTNKDEALALYGFAYTKGIVKNRISELKGE